MHLEIDMLEMLLIVSWWFLSKWVSRLVFIAFIGKVVAEFMKRAGDSFGSKFNQFTGKGNPEGTGNSTANETQKENR